MAHSHPDWLKQKSLVQRTQRAERILGILLWGGLLVVVFRGFLG